MCRGPARAPAAYVAIVDESSFSRAAERLRIAQPPLSRTPGTAAELRSDSVRVSGSFLHLRHGIAFEALPPGMRLPAGEPRPV